MNAKTSEDFLFLQIPFTRIFIGNLCFFTQYIAVLSKLLNSIYNHPNKEALRCTPYNRRTSKTDKIRQYLQD